MAVVFATDAARPFAGARPFAAGILPAREAGTGRPSTAANSAWANPAMSSATSSTPLSTCDLDLECDEAVAALDLDAEFTELDAVPADDLAAGARALALDVDPDVELDEAARRRARRAGIGRWGRRPTRPSTRGPARHRASGARPRRRRGRGARSSPCAAPGCASRSTASDPSVPARGSTGRPSRSCREASTRMSRHDRDIRPLQRARSWGTVWAMHRPSWIPWLGRLPDRDRRGPAARPVRLPRRALSSTASGSSGR